MVAFVLTLMLIVIGWPQLAGYQPLDGYLKLMQLEWEYMAGMVVVLLIVLKIVKRVNFWNIIMGVPIAALSGCYGFALVNAYFDDSPVRYRLVDIAREREGNGSKVGCSMMVVPKGKASPVWQVPLGCGESRNFERDPPGTTKRLAVKRGRLGYEWIVSLEPYVDPIQRVHH